MAINPLGGNNPTQYVSPENTVNRANIFDRNDTAGVFRGGNNVGGTLPPPLLTSKPDMMKCMAAFEDLIILMSLMAKEVQKGERMSELAALASKITQLLAAAAEKKEGASKMQTMAIVSLVISLVAATISIVGAGVQLGGAAKGAKAASDTVNTVKKEATDAAAKAANKAINKAVDEGTKNIVDKTSEEGQKAVKKAMEKAAEAGTKAAQEMDMGKVGKSLQLDLASKAFQQASSKFTGIGTVLDQAGRAVQSGAQFANTQGQVESQLSQSRADVMAAEAEKDGADAAKAQQMQQDMRDLLNKMVELLNAFYAAQDKIASAASH